MSMYAQMTPFEDYQRVDEVWPRVWMSGKPVDGLYQRFELAVSCEQHPRMREIYQARGVFHHYPMIDDENFPIDEQELKTTVEIIEKHYQKGHQILVHCTGGLNRSGLVLASWLQKRGLTPLEAIELLRKKRSEYVLCNEGFERFLLWEDKRARVENMGGS